MGRIFETRKATMFARWDKMSKAFTRIGKEIAIAVKSGGPSPDNNPALRRAVQNARNMNMPKDKVETAIKRAAGQGAEAYEEIIYEGYAPHGVAVLVETATDNPTRTVANVRSAFNKLGGNMGSTGSVGFMFKRMGVFRLNPEGVDQDSLELELRCGFNDFGVLQKALEERGITPLSAESEYIASTTIELSDAEVEEVMELVDRLEQDDDVQKVFHNLA